MLYYQSKLGCKRTCSLETIVETVIFWLYKPSCDLGLEDSEPTFLHDTPTHDNTLPYKVWFKKWLSGPGDIVQTKSDTRTGQTGKGIPVYTSPLPGIKKKWGEKSKKKRKKPNSGRLLSPVEKNLADVQMLRMWLAMVMKADSLQTYTIDKGAHVTSDMVSVSWQSNMFANQQ